MFSSHQKINQTKKYFYYATFILIEMKIIVVQRTIIINNIIF